MERLSDLVSDGSGYEATHDRLSHICGAAAGSIANIDDPSSGAADAFDGGIERFNGISVSEAVVEADKAKIADHAGADQGATFWKRGVAQLHCHAFTAAQEDSFAPLAATTRCCGIQSPGHSFL